MSKPNKVNKNNYTQRGRLTPDDMARERQKQLKVDPVPHPPSRAERASARLAVAFGGGGRERMRARASVRAAAGKAAPPVKGTAGKPAARGAVRSRSGSEE